MATKWISPTWRMPEESNQSKFENYSLEFNGTDDEIDCGNSDAINITGPISISVWFNADNTDGARGIVCKNDAAAQQTYAQYFFDLLSNEIRWRAGRNTVSYGINTGQWYHAVGVYDGSDITLYIDGTSVATDSALSTSYASSQPLYIGRRLNQDYFEGEIGQVAIYNVALTDGTGGTENQIAALYNSGTPVNPMALTPLPTAYYPLGGGSTGDAADPANTLTVPNESVPSATVFDFVPNDSIDISSDINITSNFSYSFWYRSEANSSGSYEFLLSRENTAASVTQFNIYNVFTSSGRILAKIYDSGGTSFTCDTGSGISENVWHHVAFCYSPSNYIRLYLDGVLEDENTTNIPSSIRSVTGESIRIGGRKNNTMFLNGQMSNVQMWSGTLTDGSVSVGAIAGGEVATLYNNGVPYTGTQPQAANLKAWYKLNVDEIWENVAQQWRVKNNQITPINYDRAGQSNLAYGGGYFNYVTTTNLTQSRTISLWIKYDINRQTGALKVGFFNNPSLTFHTTGFREINQASSGIVTFTVPGINVSDGGWHHILLHTTGDSADANNIAYIDGQLATRSVIGTNSFTFGNPGVGYSSRGGNLPPAAYSFSNLVMYNGDATSNVNALYNNGTPPADVSSTNPDVWWKTNSTNSSVTTLEDFSGNNNDSTTTYTQPVNMVTDNWIAESGISSGMTTANLVNSDLTRSIPYSSYSMVFDGIDDFIQLNSTQSFANEFSLSIWIKPNGFSNNQVILGNGSGSDNWIRLSSASTITFKIATGSNLNFNDVGNNLVDGVWQHLLFYRDSSNNVGIYRNGTAFSSNQTNTDTLQLTTIGKRGSIEYTGNISNVAFWSSSLTEDQVLTIYNGGTPNSISSSSPVSWWSLAGDSYFNGNDWICPDLGSASNNGTSNGMGGTELVGDGPGSTANGTATSMDIPANLKGNAPNSSKNAFSINMNSADRVEDVPA